MPFFLDVQGLFQQIVGLIIGQSQVRFGVVFDELDELVVDLPQVVLVLVVDGPEGPAFLFGELCILAATIAFFSVCMTERVSSISSVVCARRVTPEPQRKTVRYSVSVLIRIFLPNSLQNMVQKPWH